MLKTSPPDEKILYLCTVTTRNHPSPYECILEHSSSCSLPSCPCETPSLGSSEMYLTFALFSHNLKRVFKSQRILNKLKQNWLTNRYSYFASSSSPTRLSVMVKETRAVCVLSCRWLPLFLLSATKRPPPCSRKKSPGDLALHQPE